MLSPKIGTGFSESIVKSNLNKNGVPNGVIFQEVKIILIKPLAPKKQSLAPILTRKYNNYKE